jgi:hypothetical protein
MHNLISRVILVGIVCCLSGCATDPDASLNVSLTVSNAVASTATPAVVTVVIKNIGSRSVQTSPPHNYCSTGPFVIVDDAGAEFHRPSSMCLTYALSPLQLAPGDSLIIRDTWSADSGAQGRTVAVKPGQYWLTPRVFGQSRALGGSRVLVRVSTP